MAIDMKRLKFGSKVKILKDPRNVYAEIGMIGTISKRDPFHRNSDTIFDCDGQIWIEFKNNPIAPELRIICVFHRDMNPAELHNYIKVLKY